MGVNMFSVHCTVVVSLTLFQIALCLDGGLSAYERANYSVPFDCELCDPKFNHFAIHNTTGDIYLGSSNHLAHLNSDFNEIKNISTFVSCDAGIDREDCINHNKILAIYYDRDIMITCGNMNDGQCQIRNLSDISDFTVNNQNVAAPGSLTTEYVIAPASRRIGREETVTEDRLYVAASDPSKIQSPVYARRRLVKERELIGDSDNTLTLSSDAGIDFLVNYIDVFTHNRYTYFATNQRFDFDSNPYPNMIISKLNRACHDSPDLDSYAEVVIECRGSNGDVYNLIRAVHIDTVGPDLADSRGIDRNEMVLIGLFAKSVGPNDYTPDDSSAICIFELDDIEMKFISAIAACFEGPANAVNYLNGKMCPDLSGVPNLMEFIETEKCTTQNYVYPKGKEGEPITSTAIMELPSTPVSSIITATEEQHTIAFIGTATGEMLKVHLTGDGADRVYETLNLGSPVLKDIELTKTEEGEDLTVLTEQKIYRLMAENCGFYTTCEDCIGVTAEDGDPYCGWCSLTRTCTRKSECDRPDTSTRWLSYNETQCLEISNVSPYDSQPYSVQLEITVTTEQLPDLPSGENYECIFDLDNVSLNSPATKYGNNLTCMTPPTEQLPPIPEGEDHIIMLLSIKSSETGVKFVDRNFTFYRCGTHKRCLDCASSKWDCDWCTYSDICSHDSAMYCTEDSDMTLIAGTEHRSRLNPTRRGPGNCTQLKMQPGEVFLASGVNRPINITVQNLPDRFTDVAEDAYTCILHIDGTTQESQGTRMGDDEIQCSTTQYTYEDDTQELTAYLTLQWLTRGKNRTIDDEFGFNATLFKCEVLRPDCSRCVSALTTRPELLCGWCSESNMCAVNDHPQCGDIDSWIREVTGADNEVIEPNCPVPTFYIWPSSGPIEGNTVINITGTELGRSFDTIKSITVAGEECNYADYEDDYVIGERLSCRTSPGSADTTGDVLVTVAGIGDNDLINEMNKDETTFTYRVPVIDQISPQYGPQAGGTKVNITGSYLSTGSEIGIRIGNTTCVVDRMLIRDGGFICTSEESFVGNKAKISMSFDGTEKLSPEMYEYRENPTISSVSPFEAFKAGGRRLAVRGTNLDVVQAPEVRVMLNRRSYSAPCTVVDGNATAMFCPSPEVNLPFPGRRKRQIPDDEVPPPTKPLDQEATGAPLGFVMDGVRELLTWSVSNNRSFLYYQNPNYTSFEAIISDDTESLMIEGTRVDLASGQEDVTVLINTTFVCIVTSLGLNELVCAIPGELINCTEGDIFPVDIRQGNLRFNGIGMVYCNVTLAPKPPCVGIWCSIPVVAAISAVAFILLVLIVILSIIYKYRENHAREQTLKLLNEMEKLEESMATKIRDAFAQLQLDLQDLTSDLEGTGMPFVTTEQYTTNMLFSGIKTKPPTKDPIDLDDRKERAMTEFHKLLEDKNFLLTFIKVLDEPRSAPAPVIRERTKFACFLTTLMIVEDKLPYLTDVMLTVLKGYIEESVEEDKAFQLCQRTETVGERLLTNWVSVCLFKYLKDQAAFPLFVLYRAILLQTEKGPVDIVNGKAYYSLSEHSVLTLDDLKYSTITLNVIVNEDGESKPLKANNVDTISQVKEKILDLIYRNKPYSQRPDVSIVDLEWRQGRGGRLILRDSDSTTVIDEEYRKLNTLEHFKVADEAIVALVVKQNVPNGTISPSVLRRSIFVSEEEDDGEKEAVDLKTRGPHVALYAKRQRARFTIYELSPDESDGDLKTYHLQKPEDDFELNNRQSWAAAKNRLSRRVSAAIKQRATGLKKIHYPQLLTAKGATQQYVENMFEAVLDKDKIPKTIKYVFDFLEAEARTHNVAEAEIVHKWKSSCLPLRFWVTIINNPQYIFDIRESRSVTSSMSVVGQAFFDAFNRTDHKSSTQTGFNKLLYHRELEGFQSRVDQYYMAVNDLPEVDTTEIAEELDMISQQFTDIFSKMSTLQQLYHFATINNDKLLEALEENDMCKRARLAYKLENIASILEGETV